MSFRVEKATSFERPSKRLMRKYPSVKSDIDKLISELEETSEMGVALGSGLYKVRMRTTSKRTGKSGGARVITVVKVVDETVTLLTIYDKSEVDALSDAALAAEVGE